MGDPHLDEPSQSPGDLLPDPPVTGDPGVDEAVAAAARSVGLGVEEQVQLFESVHRTLQDRLADVED